MAPSSRVTLRRVSARIRPPWHKVAGLALLVVGVLVIVANDTMLLGGVPTTLLPGGHSEGYRFLGVVLAAAGTW